MSYQKRGSLFSYEFPSLFFSPLNVVKYALDAKEIHALLVRSRNLKFLYTFLDQAINDFYETKECRFSKLYIFRWTGFERHLSALRKKNTGGERRVGGE